MSEIPDTLNAEIVTYAPTAYFHCLHCEVVWQQTGFGHDVHREQAASALPADMLHEYQQVSDWVRHLKDAFGDRVSVRVIDAASFDGLWKSLRHRVRRYPAVILDGRCVAAGADFSGAEAEIARRAGPGKEVRTRVLG